MNWLRTNLSFILIFSAFILVAISHLNISTSQEKAVIDSFLLIFISALLMVLFINNRSANYITSFELICLIFILYLALKTPFYYSLDIISFSRLLFVVVLYFGLKAFILENSTSLSLILFFSTIVTLFIFIVFAGYYLFTGNEITNVYLQNKSIFSVLLASQIALVIPLYFGFRKNKPSLKPISAFALVIIVLSIILLVFTNGRSGWFGLSLALIYIAYEGINKKRIKKLLLIVSVPMIILILVLLLLHKQGSTNGRVLIYKVSAGILKDNWFFGIGNGQFKTRYNLYQALYFTRHSIDSQEATLADNSFYAFNDLFQLIIENGMMGFLFLCSAIYLLRRLISQTVCTTEYKHLFTACVASLICILTASFFSYPLQIFPIMFQAIVYLSVINSLSVINTSKSFLSITVKKNQLVFSLICLFFFIQFYFCFQFSKKSLHAFQSSRTGFKEMAIKDYRELNNSFIKDGSVLYRYAQQLYYNNELELAAQIIDDAKKYYCSNDVYKLSAQIQRALHHYPQAEKDYQTAIYMVPNRMLSRYDLLNYYVERNDTFNVIKWSNSIINMPVKVPSQITSDLRIKAQTVLLQFGRQQTHNH